MTAPLDSLRLLVAADESLQAELAAQANPAAFLDTMLAIARRCGLVLEREDLAPLTAPDPTFLAGRTPPPLRRSGWPPSGWLPYRAGADVDGRPAVDWADFSHIALDGALHGSAARLALAPPFNRLLRCRTRFADLLPGPAEGLRQPDGFIFHMSRCGSTLVARLLAALPDSYSINEAEPVDTLIRAAIGAPEDLQVAALRTIVGALGRRPSRRWFLKLSAWPALALPLFRKAFPGIPWLFVHREPCAVLASQMATRAPELEPGFTPPRLFGIDDHAALSPEDYCAAALARVCEAALAADGGLFVDHADLPDAFLSSILPHFGIPVEEAANLPLRAIAGRHAKHPDLPYQAGGTAIDPAVRAAADARLAPLHARLKAVHGGKSLL